MVDKKEALLVPDPVCKRLAHSRMQAVIESLFQPIVIENLLCRVEQIKHGLYL